MRPKVEISPIKEKDYIKTNSDYGIKYEEILKFRTLKNLKNIKSIKDPGVFSYGRTMRGLKTFILKIDEDLKKHYDSAFKDNDFFIFPFYNNIIYEFL